MIKANHSNDHVNISTFTGPKKSFLRKNTPLLHHLWLPNWDKKISEYRKLAIYLFISELKWSWHKMLTQQSEQAHTHTHNFYYHMNNGLEQRRMCGECRFGLLIKNPNHVTHIIIYLRFRFYCFLQSTDDFFFYFPVDMSCYTMLLMQSMLWG